MVHRHFLSPVSKEQIIPELFKVGLCCRYMMLSITHTWSDEKEVLISEKGRVRFKQNASPVDHFLPAVEALLSHHEGFSAR